MKIYLSFALEDSAFASELSRALRGLGHQVSITPRSGELCGADWMERIQSAEVMVLLASEYALKTEIIASEWQFAQAVRMPLGVAHLGAGLSLPESLVSLPSVDIVGETPASAAEKLLGITKVLSTSH